MRPLVYLFLTVLPLAAQMSREAIWARHDKLVLAPDGPALKQEPSWAHTFTGTKGQPVQGYDFGPADGPAILWWNGGPGEGFFPGLVTGCLREPRKYRHLILDQPGVGDGASQWIEGWKPEDTVEDAVAFLKLRGVKGPVLVAGWSWGSTMALLFAQRHPELCRGVAVGGVWANTPGEAAYYLAPDGTHALMPGMNEALAAVAKPADACGLHAAIARGEGGAAFARAYGDAEAAQCLATWPMRGPVLKPIADTPGKAVDMAAEKDPAVRFAYIESEMMCRGARGEWALSMDFPASLAQVPLVVIQGRFDQVCDPRTALRVYGAWPGARKVFIPLDTSHWPDAPPSEAELKAAGLDPSIRPKLRQALALQTGDGGRMLGAALLELDAETASKESAPKAR